jgi:peptidoglycan hydrolase-like protein with peptidoglycan-binding domain
MTPRQARVALVVFMLLSGAVAYNALYLQADGAPGRRLASEVPDAARAPGSTRAAARPQTASKAPDQRVSSVAGDPSPDTIRAIQRELNQRGYGPVSADGVMRPVTRAAIMSFEQDSKLPLTGEASDALLARLVLGGSGTERQAVANAGQVQSQHAEDTIRQVQRMLTANGYRPGPADGKLGNATIEAIRAFEQDQGLQPKGRVSAEVVSRLQTSTSKLKSAEVR